MSASSAQNGESAGGAAVAGGGGEGGAGLDCTFTHVCVALKVSSSSSSSSSSKKNTLRRGVAPPSASASASVSGNDAGDAAATTAAALTSTTSSSNVRLLLNNVSGRVLSGKLEALMGPSGSGKTTLLSVIGGRMQSMANMTVSGSVRYNGERLTKAVRQRIGFVEQEDVLLTNLTVRETLMFTARLRISRAIHREIRDARRERGVVLKYGELLAERVDQTIASLGLQKCKDTIIGDGFLKKGISGGEKKRVAVCMELLMNPSLILLDEPTSGLDATAALVLINVLQNLAETEGRALCASIHQPSFRIYDKLDSLLLLSGGRVLYRGWASAEFVTSYLSTNYQLQIPVGLSLPDWLLDLCTGHGGVGDDHDDAQAKLEGLFDAFDAYFFYAGEELATRTASLDAKSFAKDPTKPHNGDLTEIQISPGRRTSLDVAGSSGAYMSPTDVEMASGVNKRTTTIVEDEREEDGHDRGGKDVYARYPTISKKTFSQINRSLSKFMLPLSRRIEYASAGEDNVEQNKPTLVSRMFRRFSGARWGAGYHTQLQVLSLRSWKERWSKQFSWENVLLMVMIGVIISVLWWQVGAGPLTIERAGDQSGMLFFLILFPSFQSLFNAIFTFPDERRILSKERIAGMYRLSAFYFGRTVADLPIDLAFPILLHVLTYFTTGLRLTAGAYFGSLGTMLLSVIISSSVGVFLGALAMSVKLAQVMSACFMLTLMLAGGFYIQNVPFWMAWLPSINYVMYAYNLMLITQFGGQKLECGLSTDLAAAAPTGDIAEASSGGSSAGLSAGASISGDVLTDYALRCAEGGTDMPYALTSGAVLSRNLDMPAWQMVLILISWVIIFKTVGYVALDIRTRKTTKHSMLT